MQKRIFSLLGAIALCVGMANSQTQWTVQGNVYSVDTVSHVYAGPGTTITSLEFSGPSELKVFYTTTDLKNEYVDVRVVDGQNLIRKTETVSNMAEKRSVNGRNYFVGVNADFFSTSSPMYPLGTVMVDGVPVYNGSSDWHAFGITDGNVPYLGSTKLTGSVKSTNAGGISLSAINKSRETNYLVLYTPHFGATTETNAYGTEVQLVPVDESAEWKAGTTVKLKVASAPSATGSMSIPSNGFVLSGHGSSATYVENLQLDEIIEFTPKVTFDNAQIDNINQIVGGQPMILQNSVVLDTDNVIDHLPALHPRTAVGYNADKSKLVLMVVDGRSGISAGCTSKQLADIMAFAGCTDAMNFDGGGSSELYSRVFGIVNKPSGGTERAVANGVFITTSVPEDNEIAIIRFKDTSKFLPKYGYYKPIIYGYNKYGVLLDTDVEGYVLSCPATLGQITEGGSTLFCDGEGTHALTATYNGVTATLPVTVSAGELSFRLQSIIEDGYKGYIAEVLSTIDGEAFPVDNRALTWWTDDAAVATVEDGTGRVLGVANGATAIHGKLNDFEASLNVTVQKPESRYAAVDPNADLETWTFAQTGGTITEKVSLPSGMTIKYTGKGGRSPYLKLSKDVLLYSLPDSIKLRINPNEAPVSAATVMLENASGVQKSLKIDNLNLTKGVENEIRFAVSDIFGGEDRGNYPVTFKYINFGMGTSTTNQEYVVEIPGIEVVYSALPAAGVDPILVGDNYVTLSPNPVYVGDLVVLRGCMANEKVQIYSVDGKFVKVVDADEMGNANIATKDMQQGIYLVSINKQTLKLIVKYK